MKSVLLVLTSARHEQERQVSLQVDCGRAHECVRLC